MKVCFPLFLTIGVHWPDILGTPDLDDFPSPPIPAHPPAIAQSIPAPPQ